MKCKGCRLQSLGVDDKGSRVLYCIGSPEDDPKYGSEKLISKDRILNLKSGTIYRANDDDECHLWNSERFDKEKV